MSIMDKLMFWKKKDDFADLKIPDLPGSKPGHDFGAGPSPGQPAPASPHEFGSLTAGGDTTPGLGGTPPLGSQPSAHAPASHDVEITQPGYKEPEFDSPPVRHGSMGASSSMQAQSSDVISKDIEILSSKMDALKASIETINQRLANMEQYMREQKRRGGW